ncbi:MAG: hypothetical protein H7255_07695 [Ramlibacter sp.]|nr:hypothetical protein [Ramlibacter sp.]
MNASQPITASAAAQIPVFVPVLDTAFDDDYAIGCECANPALQIERWAQDDAVSFD